MDTEALLDLYDHMAWADAEAWSAIVDSEPARQDQGLRETLRHLHGAQRLYFRAWQGLPRKAPPPDFADLPLLLEWACAYYDEARAYLSALTDAALGEPMSPVWTERMEQLLGPAAGPATLGDVILQVPLHSLHHRGQVIDRLDALGVTPPIVDYAVWVWRGRPEAVWPTTSQSTH